MNKSVAADSAQDTKPAVRPLIVFPVFIGGYFVLGMAGLQLQSAQTGVSPVWPASGFAFAMVYWYGLGQVIAIVPAMLAPGEASPEGALHDADSACYEAKCAGRNRIWVHPGSDQVTT